jgi:hypothetical protein
MEYPATSPYYFTETFRNQFLDIMINRPITMNPLDELWVITSTYNLRPDLLAYDLYDDSKLWWVFAQRNPNTLVDPLFDFVTGKQIYIPQIQTLRTDLGF